MVSLTICVYVFKWYGFSGATFQQWNLASNHLLKLFEGLRAAIIYLSEDCKMHFYTSSAPNGVEIEIFIFAPANVYNIINDHLHCLVTSASTSAQLIPPGQEPAIPIQSGFTKMFSLSDSQGKPISAPFIKYSKPKPQYLHLLKS